MQEWRKNDCVGVAQRIDRKAYLQILEEPQEGHPNFFAKSREAPL